jgi:hypothetical protein
MSGQSLAKLKIRDMIAKEGREPDNKRTVEE